MVEQQTARGKATPAPHRGQLFRKYFLLILGLVCGALLISGGIGLYFAYQENTVALAGLQREKAAGAAARIEQFVREIEQQVAAAALPQVGTEGLEQRRLEFLKLLRMVDRVTDIAQIDAHGREQLSVSRLKMDEAGKDHDRSQEPAFKNARPGQTWFGPVYFRKETEPYMSIAVRSGGEAGAVTVAEVNLKFMWEVITRIRVGQKGKAYVVDGAGYLIADPEIGLVLRKTDLSGLEQVKAALAPGTDDSLAMLAKDLAGRSVLTAFAPIEPAREKPVQGLPPSPLGWKVFIEQPVSEVYSALDAMILRTVALIVAGLLFSALAAMWLARSMVRPINTLQEGAQRIGAGDLEQKIDVRTGDELQALAEQFNRMTGQLRESYSGLERKVDERTAELQQTLEQQTATSEILRVISDSPGDVKPILDAVAERATRLCEATVAAIFVLDGEVLRRAAFHGQEEFAGRETLPYTPGTLTGRTIAEGKPIHIEDLERVQAEFPMTWEMAQRFGRHQTMLAVPLMREGRPFGTMFLRRMEVRPFTDRQIALSKVFADQAAIGIENVRLFNETKEALEQQKASSEVLGTISSSIADTKPVFDKIVESCTRLFEGQQVGILLVRDDGLAHVSAYHRDQSELAEQLTPVPITKDSATGRAILAREVQHYPDIFGGKDVPPYLLENSRKFGIKSGLFAPMLWEGRGVGCIYVGREFTGDFTEKAVRLLKTFADQAVIAIQNARLFREIQEKSAQLEVANKHKSEFLANMSHELRTPLNAIIGFSEVLMERMFGEVNAKQADYLKDIHESGRHLLSLINDILDLSKIEAGRMDLELSTFDLPTALANAMTLVRERAQRHGIELSLDVDRRLGAFQADERKFKQIVVNLLSNAVKFTPDGGRVDVSAKQFDSKIEVAVRDTGIGIAPQDHAAVFEEFKQVGRDYTRKAEGTGLGLTLTKRYVELHGGAIHLESALGKGSTFTITLPLR
jgi:signal transduction histidine kinase